MFYILVIQIIWRHSRNQIKLLLRRKIYSEHILLHSFYNNTIYIRIGKLLIWQPWDENYNRLSSCMVHNKKIQSTANSIY